MSRFRNLLAGAALGALAMYYLDPISGRARRVKLRDRATARSRHLARRMERGGVHLEHDALGLAQRLAHLSPEPPADDLTLLDRVSSALYQRHPELKGSLNLEAEKGYVRVRGQVPAAVQGDRIAGFISELPGVRGVENLLHELGTPAPNKAAAIEASRPS